MVVLNSCTQPPHSWGEDFVMIVFVYSVYLFSFLGLAIDFCIVSKGFEFLKQCWSFPGKKRDTHNNVSEGVGVNGVIDSVNHWDHFLFKKIGP